jgi:hypothetical protein
MDLEKLTKHQIILLTLLVSFVTSIATGIVTVSLLDQAPPSVTQTINRIVERTVEKVVPSDLTATTVVTEKTIVVKEDDLTVQSIGNAQKSIIRIVAAGNPDILLSRGVIVNVKGVALADRAALTASGAISFEAILSSGQRVPLSIRQTSDPLSAIAVVDFAVGTSSGLVAASLADISKLQLGQSVIRIGGGGADTVGVGVIARLPDDSQYPKIEASISSVTPGSILLTIFGELVGIITSDSLSASPSADFYSVVNAATLSIK